MASWAGPVAFVSSTAIRVLGWVFLRWIPGHPFPDLIFASLAVYLTAVSARLGFFDKVFSATRKKPAKIQVNGPADGNHSSEEDFTLGQSSSDVSVARVIILGVPSKVSAPLTALTVFVNLLIVLMVVDFTFYPKMFHPAHDLSMARVGFVSDTSAKILVREPSPEKLPVELKYRQVLDTNLLMSAGTNAWTPLPESLQPDQTTDYAAVFNVFGLRPDTRYEYLTSSNHTGYFLTGPSPGKSSRSSPDSYTFVHSSCIIPNFPYVPFRHHLSIPGFGHLARRLPQLKAQFMVFLGDFIYIDVPRRFGTDKETYRREYRQVYQSPDWDAVTSQKSVELPWIHVYDDHEIANDWDKNTTGVYSSAADPWQHYQAAVNPPPVRSGASYFKFIQGPASFFLMDTRRYRTPFDGTNGTWQHGMEIKSMLGAQQRQDLLDWLAQKEPSGVKWKIVISSIPFTKNWRFGSEDTWAGYLGERQVLLEAMWQAGTSDGVGVVVLSGDRHEFAATAFPPPTTGPKANTWPSSATVHEFSASPLSMFYLPVRTYRQEDNEDVCLKYLPDGNSKFGAVKITTSPTSDQSLLHYRLFIDGAEAWTHTLTTPLIQTSSKGWGSLGWIGTKSKPRQIIS